ncbi:RagB/SusD family nutrient uptake outer membrane protein [Mariniflexile litorale]|uniref:RagB/SusD family nutrient uptake outer membrane protein n=1 Tax=Mariniflexile litorale TaxID=3045158 RepID=A0AAU7EGG6_9FLAO|nr:RagB/SusD family nutrient uptake outer membrane protein [Mariniflexile sp. KMM 9835]MDQ8210834.1 RagB/SusD family nutrient uptake outer membrane protein [Mariniflexile sp. KMM 9835]
MKRIQIKTFIASTTLMVLVLLGCSDILEEQPRSIYTPEYLKTEKGIFGGLTALYAHTRNFYGSGYYLSGVQSGTDESTWGQNVNNDAKNADFSGVGNLSSQNNPYGGIWGVFPNINTASGIIENGKAIGSISDALIAEARFFRAFDYFLLVQNFGGVPLDLGAGELKFNTSIVRTSVRNTVPEVYTKAIFPDLLQAITDLPDENSRATGTVNKTVARLYLSQAYLTYAWWLQNPNNIPTYPAAPRTDPDGHDANWYFQQAYDIAADGINMRPGSIGLLDYYYDVNEGSNDRNKEMLLYADHTEGSDLYNGAVVSGWGSGGSPGNFAGWLATWDYTAIRSATTPGATTSGYSIGSVGREAVQPHGRPWTGFAPTHQTIKNTFADKTNDSRYDGSFTTVYRGNWQRNGNTATTLYNANGLPVQMEDPILTFIDIDNPAIVYPSDAGKSGVGAGELPGRSDWIVTPTGISRLMFPGLWKLGPYRTDNGNTLGQANVTYTRPFPIAKFSELYFIAAEAAVKGASTSAIDGTNGSALALINVIRARAGKWRYDNNAKTIKIQDNSAAMVNATISPITIDYILDERTREYYGEGKRWYDLARTQTWHTRAASYTICGTNKGDHTPVIVPRTIPLTAYLRPIPQSQFDRMEGTDANIAAYQNPGYE